VNNAQAIQAEPRDERGYASLVLDRLVAQACALVEADLGLLVVRDPGQPLRGLVAAGHNVDAELIGRRIPVSWGLAGTVLRTGQPVITRHPERLRDAMAAELFPPGTSAAATPVWSEGEVAGSLGVAIAREPDESDMRLLADLAARAGRALERLRAGSLVLDSDIAAGVRSLAARIAQRDGYTGQHSEDVAGLAGEVGERLGLNDVELIELGFAARLHDIGKIEVPDHILRSTGPLTPAQWDIMRTHPGVGADMLAGVPGLQAVATVVRHHHERWDGRGYPDGLADGRIPLASRVIVACDSYMAMICDRPYRRALPDREARKALRCGSGGQFCPSSAGALLEVLEGRTG
jgi:putative nucleotidyltransferase with HDIG domain